MSILRTYICPHKRNIRMATQKDINRELIEKINDRLVFGDKAAIAQMVGKSTSYAAKVLNPNLSQFSQKIIDAALMVIEDRERKQRAFIKRLSKQDNKHKATDDAVLSINTGNI